MENSGFYRQLCEILSPEQVLCQEPMSRHTTFRTGGPADYFVMPRTEQAAEVLKLCRQEGVPCQITGNGSNLLAGDRGVRGVVLAFTKQAAHIQKPCHSYSRGAAVTDGSRSIPGGAWRYGICCRDTGICRRSGCDECRGLRGRNQRYFIQGKSTDKRRKDADNGMR